MNQDQYNSLGVGDVLVRGGERYVIVGAGGGGAAGYWDLEGGPAGEETRLVENYPMGSYWGTWTLESKGQPVSEETPQIQTIKCTIQVLTRKGT